MSRLESGSVGAARLRGGEGDSHAYSFRPRSTGSTATRRRPEVLRRRPSASDAGVARRRRRGRAGSQRLLRPVHVYLQRPV